MAKKFERVARRRKRKKSRKRKKWRKKKKTNGHRKPAFDKLFFSIKVWFKSFIICCLISFSRPIKLNPFIQIKSNLFISLSLSLCEISIFFVFPPSELSAFVTFCSFSRRWTGRLATCWSLFSFFCLPFNLGSDESRLSVLTVLVFFVLIFFVCLMIS